MGPIPIKYLPNETKVLRSRIATSIKEFNCYSACKSVARHCENESSQIQGVDFDQSYSLMGHADYFIINIDIADIHRFITMILDFIHYFQNKNVPNHERFCVIPPTYYLDWFEKYHPNVSLDQDDSTFFLQCINGTHEKPRWATI